MWIRTDLIIFSWIVLPAILLNLKISEKPDFILKHPTQKEDEPFHTLFFKDSILILLKVLSNSFVLLNFYVHCHIS